MSPVWSRKAGLGESAAMRVDRRRHGRSGIGIGGLVEADMGVADLDEAEPARGRRRIAQQQGAGHAAAHGPEQAGARPGHAAEDAAAVHAVVI